MIRPGFSVMDMLTDRDEGRFLLAFFATADNRHTLLTYAGHLRGRDEVREEFLRLEYLLSRTDHIDEIGRQSQARYRELLRLLVPFAEWLRIVKQNDRILNCGQGPPQPLAVRFRYQCPNQWETLSLTQEAEVRYCGSCQRNVYFCDSVESVEQHAREGDCIAVRKRVTALAGEELTCNMTGRPDVHQLWGEKLFGG